MHNMSCIFMASIVVTSLIAWLSNQNVVTGVPIAAGQPTQLHLNQKSASQRCSANGSGP